MIKSGVLSNALQFTPEQFLVLLLRTVQQKI